jgi:hypothetical protein
MTLSESRFPVHARGRNQPLFESKHPLRGLRPFSDALLKFAPADRATKAANRRNAMARSADREAIGARGSAHCALTLIRPFPDGEAQI